MDPPSLINEGSFPSANASAYSLDGIWPFPLNSGGGVSESGGDLGLRRSPLGQNSGGFAETTRTRIRNRDVSVDESTVTENSGRKRIDAASEDESSKLVSTNSGNDLNVCNGKRIKLSGSRDKNGGLKAEMESSLSAGNKPADQSTQPSEPPKQDYIHVRARRGQATDSHSLAERVILLNPQPITSQNLNKFCILVGTVVAQARREKISERMKLLQDLVPNCNKVIGKSLVLDEIINYIQSLQRQVEFLSMKLEAVNSRMNPGIEGFPLKDFGAQTFTAGMTFSSQATREYGQGSPPEWLHMQVGGGFERAA
ncbi:hypothetical protein HHK36_029692 [Tetracentron sinense]|uniref:BHLH domain-containing protein n=1 Tax=Tetracentron sinense TaxID=13715 RepID=A0A834Y9Y8_TETSI|nr:hypothetical protein HHK36_029692 [Tetracentron sinense]